MVGGVLIHPFFTAGFGPLARLTLYLTDKHLFGETWLTVPSRIHIEKK